MTQPRILVIGANFAGVAASRALSGNARVVVADSSPSFEWLPNVHELVSGVKSPSALRADRRSIVARHGSRFLLAEIEHLDPEHGVATTARGRRLRFDACVVAVGGTNDTYGIPGADRYAMPFKSVAQCDAIGRRLARMAKRGEPMRVSIVGGGLEGVEALGEILRRYRDYDGLVVTLIDASRRLMNGTPKALHTAVADACKRYDVRLLLGRSVNRVGAKSVRLVDGERIGSDVTLWTGGARPAPCLYRWGLAADRRSWAEVDASLCSRRLPGVFVAGDAAALPKSVAKQAYHALDMGAVAARNALALIKGQPLEHFEASPKPQLVAFGDLDTFLVTGDRVWASPALAWAKEAVFQATMAQIDPPTDRRAVSAVVRRALPALRRAVAGGMRVESLVRLLSTRGL
jgi:NADH dehydrogenase